MQTRKKVLLVLLVLSDAVLVGMQTNLNLWPFALVICAPTAAMIIWEVRIMRRQQQRTEVKRAGV